MLSLCVRLQTLAIDLCDHVQRLKSKQVSEFHPSRRLFNQVVPPLFVHIFSCSRTGVTEKNFLVFVKHTGHRLFVFSFLWRSSRRWSPRLGSICRGPESPSHSHTTRLWPREPPHNDLRPAGASEPVSGGYARHPWASGTPAMKVTLTRTVCLLALFANPSLWKNMGTKCGFCMAWRQRSSASFLLACQHPRHWVASLSCSLFNPPQLPQSHFGRHC